MTTLKIIHLSDLHIGGDNDEAGQLRRIVRKLKKYYAGHPVVITGDVVESGRLGEMARAETILDNLAETNPIVVVPGNHDYAWYGLVRNSRNSKVWAEELGDPMGPWKKHIPRPWMKNGLGVLDTPEFRLIGLDTGDPNDEERAARGYVSNGLLEHLAEALENVSSKLRIVIMHHHPFDDGHFVKLVGAEKLMATLSGNCEMLLFGHKHKFGIWRGQHGIPFICASHKSTAPAMGDHLGVGVVQVTIGGGLGGSHAFWHRMEMI